MTTAHNPIESEAYAATAQHDVPKPTPSSPIPAGLTAVGRSLDGLGEALDRLGLALSTHEDTIAPILTPPEDSPHPGSPVADYTTTGGGSTIAAALDGINGTVQDLVWRVGYMHERVSFLTNRVEA